MKRPEQSLHQAVVAHMRLRCQPLTFWWHTPNEGKRGWVNAAHLRAMGMQAGIPDLLILKAGELFGLELKSAKGRLTPSQVLTMQRLMQCGAQVAVAKSLDEALVTLECWGVIKRNVNVASAYPETSPQGQPDVAEHSSADFSPTDGLHGMRVRSER